MTMPRAAELMRSVLDGLDELFTRTGVEFWDEQVRKVAAFESPTTMARAYASMSQGSASGTFHDRIISAFNHDPVTVRQEPYVNALLATFRSIGLACVDAITSNGDGAQLEQPTADTASEYWERWRGHDVPSRWHTVVTGVRCRTCDSRYLLDSEPDWVAARRWSLSTAPAWIESGRSRQLVDAAMDPDGHTEIRAELEAVRPAFQALGLRSIPLPYNRLDRGPNDRCRVCGADTWTTTGWLLIHHPPRLEPMVDVTDLPLADPNSER